MTLLLRLFFLLLYNQLAWLYDSIAWLVSFGHWRHWGQAALPHLRGQRVLELAHGPGHLLVAMRRSGRCPLGLDLSPAMGRLASARLRRSGLAVPLVRARAQALPFRAGAFDSVVSTFPTEFILDPATLDEAARVLGEGGRLVIVPGVAFDSHSRPYRFLKWLYRVTGQAAWPPSEFRLAHSGLAWSFLQQPSGAVNVHVIIAERIMDFALSETRYS
ncbi:MAG: methyltransferase domain-containing protein [Thermoflexales bacterium]|nr:methyltransferase domain-containing protein [Thermoflexales bacterium]